MAEIRGGSIYYDVEYKLSRDSLKRAKDEAAQAGKAINSAIGKSTSASATNTKAVDKLKTEIRALKNESLALRNAYEGGIVSQDELTYGMKRLNARAKDLTRGLDRQSSEFKDLSLVAGRASRTLRTVRGEVTKLGLSGNVVAALNRVKRGIGGIAPSAIASATAVGVLKRALASLLLLAAPLLSFFAIFKGFRILDNATQSAANAAVQYQILAREVQEAGETFTDANNLLANLSTEFRVHDSVVAQGAVQLLRYGATLEQTEKLLRRGGASALAFGKDVATGFEAIAQAIVGEQSQILNRYKNKLAAWVSNRLRKTLLIAGNPL